MSRKSDDFERQLESYLADPEFAHAFAEETDKLRVAVKIAEMREKKGLTQKELARKIKTTQSVISRLESSGYENYSVNTLRKVAEALQCDLVIELKGRGGSLCE